jgi:hypothetical protein
MVMRNARQGQPRKAARAEASDPPKRKELDYEDDTGAAVGIAVLFFGGLLVLALALFFFGRSPEPSGAGKDVRTELQRPVTTPPVPQ